MINTLLSQTNYTIQASKAIVLFADSSNVSISYAEKIGVFVSFGVFAENGSNKTKLAFKNAENTLIEIVNPNFVFDEKTSAFYVEHTITKDDNTSETTKYNFNFFSAKKINLCTIKNLLS